MYKINVFNQSLGLFLQGKNQGGKITPEQMDDELELRTGCRFGNPTKCSCPDCPHPPALN